MRSERGFTLVELLVSMAIMVGITGVIFSLVDPSRGTYRHAAGSLRHAAAAARRHESLDQRSVMAGAGAPAGGTLIGSLMNFFAPISRIASG